jgi:hypothetical protein
MLLKNIRSAAASLHLGWHNLTSTHMPQLPQPVSNGCLYVAFQQLAMQQPHDRCPASGLFKPLAQSLRHNLGSNTWQQAAPTHALPSGGRVNATDVIKNAAQTVT